MEPGQAPPNNSLYELYVRLPPSYLSLYSWNPISFKVLRIIIREKSNELQELHRHYPSVRSFPTAALYIIKYMQGVSLKRHKSEIVRRSGTFYLPRTSSKRPYPRGSWYTSVYSCSMLLSLASQAVPLLKISGAPYHAQWWLQSSHLHHTTRLSRHPIHISLLHQSLSKPETTQCTACGHTGLITE